MGHARGFRCLDDGAAIGADRGAFRLTANADLTNGAAGRYVDHREQRIILIGDIGDLLIGRDRDGFRIGARFKRAHHLPAWDVDDRDDIGGIAADSLEIPPSDRSDCAADITIVI